MIATRADCVLWACPPAVSLLLPILRWAKPGGIPALRGVFW